MDTRHRLSLRATTTSFVQHITGCCFESLLPGASRRTNASSPAKTSSSEPNVRASEQPCAQGGCRGRGPCSAWVTTGYPRESYRERTRENVDRRRRRNNERTAWERIVGYLASRGTGASPHLTLGFGKAQYAKGAVCLWLRG